VTSLRSKHWIFFFITYDDLSEVRLGVFLIDPNDDLSEVRRYTYGKIKENKP
jgi:hypothetical protein